MKYWTFFLTFTGVGGLTFTGVFRFQQDGSRLCLTAHSFNSVLSFQDRLPIYYLTTKILPSVGLKTIHYFPQSSGD